MPYYLVPTKNKSKELAKLVNAQNARSNIPVRMVPQNVRLSVTYKAVKK
jgi:hypothetical protein